MPYHISRRPQYLPRFIPPPVLDIPQSLPFPILLANPNRRLLSYLTTTYQTLSTPLYCSGICIFIFFLFRTLYFLFSIFFFLRPWSWSWFLGFPSLSRFFTSGLLCFLLFFFGRFLEKLSTTKLLRGNDVNRRGCCKTRKMVLVGVEFSSYMNT